MVLLSVRPYSAARLHSTDPDDRLTTGGSQEQFPECLEVAKSTFPGGCNTEKSAYACYSLQEKLEDTDLNLKWRCSDGFDKFGISKEDCTGSGMYAGACQFSVLPESSGESEKAATTPEQSSAVATTVAATTPEQPTTAATTPEKASVVTTTPEQLTEAATTPEQPKAVATTTEQSTEEEELPECETIAKSTYPGHCNTQVSGFACYSMEKVYRPKDSDIEVDVPWGCSNGDDKTGISKKACSDRPWIFEGDVQGKQVKFEAQAGIYAGACKFSTLPESQKEATTKPEDPTEAVTTPEQLTEAATTPEESTEAVTTPKQLTDAGAATTPEESATAATTPMQPLFGPTTTKNGAAGNSAGSLFATVLGLAVYCLQ